MKKILLLLFTFSSFYSIAQLPFIQGFETGMGYTADADVIDNLDDYFARMNTACGAADPCRSNFNTGYAGWLGTYYWAGEDHDDSGVGGSGNATLCITLDPIDISTNTTGVLEIGAYYAACDFGCNSYDPGVDFVALTYSVDGAAVQTAQSFSYYTTDGGTSEFLAYDEDNSGVVDGAESTILTETFTRFTRVVAASGNNLVLTVCAHMNSGSEEWAIDAIEVSSAMPVELSRFNVRAMKGGAMLNWETATETDNEYFAIERSTNGLDFEEIDQVIGQGTSFEAYQYEYFDAELPDSRNVYYRLVQMDYDGTFSISQVKVISNTLKNGQLRLTPNPASNAVEIDLTSAIQGDIEIQLFDIKGQLVQSNLISGDDKRVIDISQIPQGQYILKAQSETYSWIEKLIKI